MIRSSSRIASVALATVALVTTACSAARETARPELDPAATLVYADSTGPETLDPDRNPGGYLATTLHPAYETLIELTTQGDELAPGLATEWEFVNETTFEMRLREGVVFHDGTSFDAQAVVANFERSMTLEESSPEVRAAVEPIESVEAVDVFIVRINLSGSSYTLPYQLTQNVGMMISPTALDNPDLDRRPVGAGMYKVVEFRPGDRVLYEAFEDYWDPDAVGAARLEILNTPDAQTRLSAVTSGQVDLTFIGSEGLSGAQSAGLEVIEDPKDGIYHLYSNKSRGALQDVRVRQAIMYAIDRDAIIDQILLGLGDPTVQVFPPNYYAYNEDYPPDYYAYDPQKARELIAESGLQDVTLSLLVTTRPFDQRMAQVVQAQLGDVGIDVELQVIEPSRVQLFFAEQETDLLIGRWAGRVDPYDTLFALVGAGGLNPGGGTTERMTELLEQIRQLPIESEERIRLIQEASGEAVEQALDLPLFGLTQAYVSRPGCIIGFEPSSTGGDTFRGTGVAVGC